MDESPDDILVEEARAGNLAAFGELARRHQQRVYRLVYGMTRNHCDADDLAQEVFLTAFKSLRSYRRNSSFYTWIYRIAVNRALNFLKKEKRAGTRAEFDENRPYEAAAVRLSPEAQSVRSDMQDHLDQAVEALPPLFKATFLLVAVQGLAHAEAAEVLGCSENTVAWRMHKARKLLQVRLKPVLTEGGS